MDETKDIELRSEKVRNIIGQIPPRLIRIGITVIFVVILALLSGAYFFRFNHTIDAPATMYVESNRVHYSIEVPYNKLKYLETGQKLVITVHSRNSFATTIQHIDTTLHINKEHSYFQVQGIFDNAIFKLDEPIKDGQTTVYTDKINLIEYVLNN